MESYKNFKTEICIKVLKDGPYLIYGMSFLQEEIIYTDEEGISTGYKAGKIYNIPNSPVSLCRCGKTCNSPFCDGTHSKINFNGQETAKFEKAVDNAKIYYGAKYNLIDKEELCALARFCDAKGSIWELIQKSDEESCQEVLKQANLCPSGRLIITDKNNNIIEEEYQKAISIIEDNGLKVSGPIRLKGGITVESAEGKCYEARNRQTLCRCGKSKNKPFCDCSHFHTGFHAGKQD